jgi:pimeloyl-ACP methyl ester carboxylesterase
MLSSSYAVVRAPRTDTCKLRDLTFQLYRWSGDDPRPTVLVHGWGDTGATWQFLVDRLSPRRTCVAVDMRGFGRTERPPDGYWFPDYLADLDALLDVLSPEVPVDLVGHSMGGNVAMLYAGVRPHRIRRLVTLEGFGMSRTTPDQAPARYAEWLDEVKAGSYYATYDDYEQFERILARRNPRTPPERIQFIARSWAFQRPDGRIELWADPKHKRVNPVLYQREQAEACWREIVAPILFVTGAESELVRRMGHELSEPQLRQLFRDVTFVSLAGAGHMLQHEQPAVLAAAIDSFLD